MRYITKLANMQDYALSNVYQYWEMFVYSAVSFFLPLFIGHPQIVVGIVVNALLIAAALNLKGYKLWPIILLPSLGVLSRGLIFGPYTIYLLYLIPFIWVGNAIFVFTFKWLKMHRKRNYWLTLVAGSLFKSAFLFTSAFVLYTLGVLPVIFLTAMGVLQLGTAIGGGVVAFGYQAVKKSMTKYS